VEPSVQYALTADGVRIALYTLGQGPAVVVLPTGPWSSIPIEMGISAWRAWHARLAQTHTVVRYDLRGTGLSDRTPIDFSLAAQLRDLEAVHDRLGLTSYALLAVQHAGPVALAYAVQHPQRVSHLLLWCTYARGADYFEAPQSQTLHDIMAEDWALFTETMTHARVGWAEGDLAHAVALLARDSLTPELLATFDGTARTIDVGALLPRVQARTLVLQRRQVRYPDVTVAVRLAADIPNARLLLLDGDSIAPFAGDGEAAIAAIEAFVGEGAPTAAASANAAQARPTQPLVDPLSARELEVLSCLAEGQSNAEIAHTLFVSVGTVKTHINSIYRKLDVKSRTRAVARARSLNLLDSTPPGRGT
jgi:DNA-binding CsgD family transcriptional regulator/pimeloyl-ACP methyl ester carboxylesterase